MPRLTFSHGECPICGCQKLVYAFGTSGGAYRECADCGLMILDPTQSRLEQKARQFWDEEERTESSALTDEERCAYLDLIEQHAPGKRLLEIGCGKGEFLAAAKSRGFEVAGFEGNGPLADAAKARLGEDVIRSAEEIPAAYADESFDVVVVYDLMGHFPSVVDTLRAIRRFLREDGLLVFCVPMADSLPARALHQQWIEFHKRNTILFDTNTVQNALFLTGFDRTLLLPRSRQVSIDWLREYLRQFEISKSLRSLLAIAAILPGPLRRISRQIDGGHALVMTHARDIRREPVLSVVVPVYNERNTFSELMDALVAKEIPGLRKEIIVVESNSTDGTREEVMRYENVPGVRIVLQEKARGKGNAVRAGMEAATGDYVLIQDADLEYDLNDYESLLEPLAACRQAFVIGSRHTSNNWKRRQFKAAPGLAFFYNTGHLIFLTLFNLVLGQRLQDPFSMFKVFRRECLYGLNFECNRFDYDWELAIKLLRKGYRVIEIPVSYNSRSHTEGKKVSTWRDPLTWLRAAVKFRFQPLNVWENAKATIQNDRKC